MWVVLVAAAALAGAMNALAGGGTLVTFPSLLAFGVSPVAANATSTVALVPGGVGGFWGFRHDVAGDRRELLWMAVPSLVGGALGALLVLWVGNRTFARVVPWLIYGATLLFVAQAPIRRFIDRRIGADGAPAPPRAAGARAVRSSRSTAASSARPWASSCWRCSGSSATTTCRA